MDIGDWEVEVLEEKEIIVDPEKKPFEKQHYIVYSFFYKPLKIKVTQGIQYIAPHDADKRLEILAARATELKREFIDKLDRNQSNDQ
jgi:hypothetical protein